MATAIIITALLAIAIPYVFTFQPAERLTEREAMLWERESRERAARQWDWEKVI